MDSGASIVPKVTITAALTTGTAEEREAAYSALDSAVTDQSIALLIAAVQPLMRAVLCAPASKIGADEHVRAALLLYEMTKVDITNVWAATNGRDEPEDLSYLLKMISKPGTAFTEMLAREPNEWTRGDAILAAANFAFHLPCWANGITPSLAVAELDEMEWFMEFFQACPFHGEPFGQNPEPVDRYTTLALLALGLLREAAEMDGGGDPLPEGVIVGAAGLINWITLYPPAGCRAPEACWEAGYLDIMQALLRRYNPMERINRHIQIPGAVLAACKDIVHGAMAVGHEVIQPLLDAGAVDIAVSSLQAYQMMNRPSECNVNSVQWGALWFLEELLASPRAADAIIARLRSAGVDAFRYILDHPLVMMGDLGYETGPQSTKIAAIVWGRDDDGGGIAFKQTDIDKLVFVADPRNHPAFALTNPITVLSGRIMLNLSISEINKDLLLNAEGLIPLWVDSLLVRSDHPWRSQPDFARIAPVVQRDFTEAFAQLAVYPPGREALLQDPNAVEALRQVAAVGLVEEARRHAESALAALSDHQPEEYPDENENDEAMEKHLMISYQWDHQHVMKRIVRDLKARHYRTW